MPKEEEANCTKCIHWLPCEIENHDGICLQMCKEILARNRRYLPARLEPCIRGVYCCHRFEQEA